jgi:hypothetical protein
MTPAAWRLKFVVTTELYPSIRPEAVSGSGMKGHGASGTVSQQPMPNVVVVVELSKLVLA